MTIVIGLRLSKCCVVLCQGNNNYEQEREPRDLCTEIIECIEGDFLSLTMLRMGNSHFPEGAPENFFP